MASFLTAILKATVGLLVNKGRDLAAEKLKDGDTTDQQFRKLVVRELDDIKSKIDGLARKDLLASVSFFKEGLEILYQLLDQPELREFDTERPSNENEKMVVGLPSASGASKLSVAETSSLVAELKMLKPNELCEKSKHILAAAKIRFQEARVEATRAFSNEALKTPERILAIKIRIMATLMEDVENPSMTALASCRLCLEELHNFVAVQNCFEVEINKPMKYRFNKNERREVIAEVCHMNFVVYNVTKMMGGDWRDVFNLRYIIIDKLKVDPLRDSRLTKALTEFKLERCCLREWTFGQEGEVNHRLDQPQSITTNTQGQFIVADVWSVKVFDSSGKFLQSVFPFTDDEEKEIIFRPWRVATDGNGNLYVLASVKKTNEVEWCGVYAFDRHYTRHRKFPLREEVRLKWKSSLTVNNDGKVFLFMYRDGVFQVNVYETDGKFVHSFGQGILSFLVRDITTANDDRVMVLDGGDTHLVHVFSTQGDHLHQFGVQGDTSFGAIAFHQPSEHVIVSSTNPDNEYRGQVSIYTKNGEFVRSVQLETNKTPFLLGLAVTVDGRVAVINGEENKVHIIPF